MIPPRFAANVAWLFTEVAWLDRFHAAREAGFAAVEFPWPDDPGATAEAVRAAGLRVALLNAPAGDLAAGERGWPNDPSRVDEWREAFASAMDLAVGTGCPTINVLAGNRVPDLRGDDQLVCLEANVAWAVVEAGRAGVTVVTELLNRRENPDYLLATLDDADPLLERLTPLGWRIQLDTWHLALAGSDVAASIGRAGPNLGHVQIADAPGRHEPGTGSLDWPAIGAALRAIAYDGSVGLEYVPTGGFDWVERLSLGD